MSAGSSPFSLRDPESSVGLVRAGLDFLVAARQFLAQRLADHGGVEAALFFLREGTQRRHRDRLALVVHGHHGEEAAVGMAHRALANVLGHNFDANFQQVQKR